jgi:hypothetical protein
MQQYIYFENKTEYIFNQKKVEQFPIGKLLFAFLDVDWYALALQADAVQEKINDNEDKPYFLVAAIYQQHREILQAFHPHLFRLVDTYMEEKIEKAYHSDYPNAQAFAVLLFRHYPNEPMSTDFFQEFMYGGEPVSDEPLVAVADSFIQEITQLYLDLQYFSADLQDMVKFALDGTDGGGELNARQRYYLMQIMEYAPLVNCMEQYNNVSIERRILDETEELNYNHHVRITPELIQEIRGYKLDAYTFYRSSDIRALVFLELEYMCTNELKIRRCERCGRYFLPFSMVSLFCDRLIEGTEKTCKDIGAIEKYNRKVMADEARNLFRRLNNAYHMRTKRAPAVYTREAYEAWRDNSRELLKQVEAGMLSVDEFEGMVQIDRKRD